MRRSYLGLMILVLLTLSGCEGKGDKSRESGRVMKVGVIVPLSGDNASIGRKALEGLQAASILHPLTTKGDRIALIVHDDQSTPEISADLIKKLVKEENIDALVALSTSDEVLEMLSAIDLYRIPTVVAIASHDALTRSSAYVSRVCMDNAQQSKVAAYFIHDELLFDKSALFYTPKSAYSESLTSSFAHVYEKIGGKIIVRLRSDISDTALSMSLERIRDEGVEAIYTSVKGERAMRLLKVLKRMDWDVVVIGSDGLLGSLRMHGLHGSGMVDGSYVIENYAEDSMTTPEEKRLHAYEEDAEVALNTHSFLAYESYLLLLEAFSHCSDPCSRDELNGRLRDAEVFAGINDRISTTEGNVRRPIFINKILNGKMTMHLKVY